MIPKVGLDRHDLAKNCTSMLRVQVNNSEISMNGILVPGTKSILVLNEKQKVHVYNQLF